MAIVIHQNMKTFRLEKELFGGRVKTLKKIELYN